MSGCFFGKWVRFDVWTIIDLESQIIVYSSELVNLVVILQSFIADALVNLILNFIIKITYKLIWTVFVSHLMWILVLTQHSILHNVGDNFNDFVKQFERHLLWTQFMNKLILVQLQFVLLVSQCITLLHVVEYVVISVVFPVIFKRWGFTSIVVVVVDHAKG